MASNRTISRLLLAILTAATAGCGTTKYTLYEGASRPPAEISVLEISYSLSGHSDRLPVVCTIDGVSGKNPEANMKGCPTGGRQAATIFNNTYGTMGFTAELLPGQHIIEVVPSLARFVAPTKLKLDASPNRRYTIRLTTKDVTADLSEATFAVVDLGPRR